MFVYVKPPQPKNKWYACAKRTTLSEYTAAEVDENNGTAIICSNNALSNAAVMFVKSSSCPS